MKLAGCACVAINALAGLVALASCQPTLAQTTDAASAQSDAPAAVDATTTADAGGAACVAASGFDASAMRGGNADILPLSGYDYAPSIIAGSDGTYRAWWCGLNAGPGGDEIRYAEAASLDGPWHSHGGTTPNTFDVAMTAPGTGTAFFDTTDTCDPFVVQVPDGTYYLYYGGNGAPFTGAPNNTTQMGVASSPSGLPGTWTKLNDEQPIVTPQVNEGAGSYGAGQPSVAFVDDYLYMVYTDTTGRGGAGIYVLRASPSNPTFQPPDVETFDGFGFVPLSDATKTLFRISPATGVDWAYSDAAHAFILAEDDTFSSIQLDVVDPLTFAFSHPTEVPAGTADGPGMVHTADGHVPASTACGALPIDLLRAECYASAGDTTDCGADPYGGTNSSNISLWDLAHVGVTLDAHQTCACEGTAPAYFPSVQIDAPAPSATISGANVLVGGWAIDNTNVVGAAIDPASIAVSVDGVLAGNATYGGARPDVCAAYPGRVGCPNVGYNFTLDTTTLANGVHTITVRAANLAPLSVSGASSQYVTVAN